MEFKMHWDAIVDYEDRLEIRMGIHVFYADDEKDAIKRALHFLHNGAFIDWDAFLENEDFFMELGE